MTETRYLIDTHVLLWELMGDGRISDAHRAALDSRDPKLVSVASIWEIAIKTALGKLHMPPRLLEVLEGAQIGILPINADHAMRCATMLPHHADPFDRMLIAQAQIEGLTVLTMDKAFRQYEVAVL